MRAILIAALLAVLAGCASTATQEQQPGHWQTPPGLLRQTMNRLRFGIL